jgi:hypothetical protein
MLNLTCGISDRTSPSIDDIGFGNCTKSIGSSCSNPSPHTPGASLAGSISQLITVSVTNM